MAIIIINNDYCYIINNKNQPRIALNCTCYYRLHLPRFRTLYEWKKESRNRLDKPKASLAFGKLRLWNNRHVLIRAKGDVYHTIHVAVVWSSLLYGAESWAIYKTPVKNLNM